MKKVDLLSRVFAIGMCIIGNAAILNAQDIIQLRDGNEIEAKVLSISEKEIVYKKYQNLSGPDRIIPVNSVLFIKYENGEKEIFQQKIRRQPNRIF